MSNIVGGQIIWNLDVDKSKFDDGMKSASNTAKNTGEQVDNSMKSMSKSITSSFDDAVAGSKKFAFALGAVITTSVGMIGYGVKIAADLESARQGFITLTGSAKEADRILAMVKKDAALTPFELPGLIKANQLLTSVTKDGDRSEKMLLNVGKALAAMGKGQPELDRIIVNLQQIGAVGKASMIDIKQFAFAGIPIFDMLKEKMKDTTTVITDNSKAITKNTDKISDLKNKLALALKKQSEFNDKTKESTRLANTQSISKYTSQISALEGELGSLNSTNGQAIESATALEDAISDGKITFELLEEMFNEAGSAGGKFATAFTDQAGTFNQLISNLKDNIGIAASQIVKDTGIFDILKKTIKTMSDEIGKHTDDISKAIKDAFQWSIDNFPILAGIILGALTPAFISLGISIWTALAPLIPFIVAGVIVGILIDKLIKQLGGWDEAWKAIQRTMFEIEFIYRKYIEPSLKELWKTISEELIPELKELWQILSPVLIPILKLLAVTVLGLFIGGLWLVINVIKEVIYWISRQIDRFNDMINFFRDFPRLVGVAFSQLKNALTRPFNEALRDINSIADRIKEKLDWINPFHRNSPSLVDNVIAGVKEIKKQYAGLTSIQLPAISSQSPSISYQGEEGSFSSKDVTVNIGEVKNMQDIEMISREIGYRFSLI